VHERYIFVGTCKVTTDASDGHRLAHVDCNQCDYAVYAFDSAALAMDDARGHDCDELVRSCRP
jgi:hypothetical protein